jgi:hypothetical protein
MSDDMKARGNISEYETELKIANGFDLICSPPGDPSIERLTVLKEQLLTLLLCLQREELSCDDAKAQALRIQEELSKIIWAVGDWQIQFASRN